MKRTYTLQITREQMKEYAKRFRAMRLSVNLLQKEMAQELGIHVKTYSRWERAAHIPDEDIKEIEQRIKKVIENLGGNEN